MIRVLLVDDQPMVRAGLSLVLRSQPDIQVVGERDNGDDIVAAVTECAPDMVCMDVRMPGTAGVAATRLLTAAAGPPVCILTTFGDTLTNRESDVLRLMARGASNREIADHLNLAETTVKTHVGTLFTKLGARDRAAAIVFAYDSGLVRPQP